MSALAVNSPRVFPDAIRTFPRPKQMQVCSLASYGDGGGMTSAQLRKVPEGRGPGLRPWRNLLRESRCQEELLHTGEHIDHPQAGARDSGGRLVCVLCVDREGEAVQVSHSAHRQAVHGQS